MRLHHRITSVVTAAVVAVGLAAVVPAAPASAATAPATGRFTALDTTQVYAGTVGTTAKVIPMTSSGNAKSPVPANATAVVVNVEVSNPTAAGYVRVTPGGVDATVATQEFSARQKISNLATVKLGRGGVQVKLSKGSANLYLDVSGYYADGSSGATYTPLPTTRVFTGPVSLAGGPQVVQMAGAGGVPDDATAVVVNTEVSGPTSAGYVRVTPAGQNPPVATQLFSAGQTISNLAVVKLVDGAVQVRLSAGQATVFMDVSGYYSSAASGSVFVPLDTTRAYGGPVSSTLRSIPLAGIAGVPGTATGVVANAEVAGSTTDGYLRIVPAGQDAQVATQVFRTAEPISNAVMTKVTGTTAVRNIQAKVSKGSGTLFLDVAGYFLDGSSGSGFGADVSWPQGGSASGYPTNQAFGIVGVNGSLPNQSNGSLQPQLSWAAGSTGGTSQPKVQVYVLAANPGKQASVWPRTNRDPNGATVKNPYGTCTGKYDAACSYMYGYTRGHEDTHSRGITDATAYTWWIDVETGLSWLGATDASDHLTQNRADIEGMVAALRAAGAPTVGIYSTKAQFRTIVGTVPSSSPLTGLPSWIAVGSDGAAAAQSACRAGGLTAGSTVRMTQFVAGGFDRDVSCV